MSRLAQRVTHAIRVRRLLLYSLPQGPPALPDTAVSAEPVDLAPDQIHQHEVLVNRGRAETAARRMAEGHGCLSFVDPSSGAFVSYNWLTAPVDAPVGAPLAFGLRLEVSTRELYLWDCYTPPEWRGRGLFRSAIGEAAQRARQDGRRGWIACEQDNESSRRAIESAGCALEARLSIVKVGPARLLRWGGRIAVKRRGAALGLAELG